ncbi:MAG: glycoside hydrolase family 88 protein [Pseudomonadota bacterium]
MSSRDTTRARHNQRSMTQLARRLFGLSLLSLPFGCSSDKSSDHSQAVAGASGSPAISAGAGGSNAGSPSQSGSGGASTQAGGASAGTASAGTAGLGAGGQTPAGGGSANGSCTFQCVDQCVELGGTKKDGSCAGAQVCCDGATAPVNPLTQLVPSAREVGLLLANRFSKQAVPFTSVKNLPGDGYKVACEWYGAFGVAKATTTQSLVDSLVTKFNPLKGDFVSAMTGGEAHVDRYIFGIVPLEIYLQTADAGYLPLGTQVADKQQSTDQVRDAIDDMFMMTILQVQAYRATKDDKYLKFMAPIMVDYLKAQKTNGLFNHNDAQAPVQWGRGNGWFAAGMAEILKDLPTTSAQYPTIQAGYKKMMEGLLKYQGKNGLWYQVLDQPSNASNWEETSGSAMFTFAMIVGVRRGLLDAATYVPAIEAAWAGLRKKISAQGDVSDIGIGTYFHATAKEYTDLARLTGDGHGQAPVLWSAAELLR